MQENSLLVASGQHSESIVSNWLRRISCEKFPCEQGTSLGENERRHMVTIERMRAISAAFNSRDVERIVDCFADDGIFCLARGPEAVGRTLKGKAAIRRALADRFKQIPDMRWENEEYILAGPDRAISLWTVRG